MLTRKLEINEVLNNQQIREIFFMLFSGRYEKIKSNEFNDSYFGQNKALWWSYYWRYLSLYWHGSEWRSKDERAEFNVSGIESNGVEIHFFEVLKPKEYTYRGEVQLAGEPYQEPQKDRDGRQRKVWVFPLRLLNSKAYKDIFNRGWCERA